MTPLLTDARLASLRSLGVKVASLSIDGSSPATHDAMRGIPGHLTQSIDAIRRMRAHDFVVQINTTVTPANVHELPAIAELLIGTDANIWEVFFLVNVGRGSAMQELTPEEHEDVCQFLYDASEYGFVVRTVEGPMFRRIVQWRQDGVAGPTGELYRRLADELVERLGPPTDRSKAQARGTRDGRGIVFVSSTGEVMPAGFLPLVLGNVRDPRHRRHLPRRPRVPTVARRRLHRPVRPLRPPHALRRLTVAGVRGDGRSVRVRPRLRLRPTVRVTTSAEGTFPPGAPCDRM